MIVYVETNFMFELAFGRAQSSACQQLLDWCDEKAVQLRLPAFALTEARSALRRREKERFDLTRHLRVHHDELIRLKGSTDLAESCRTAAEAIGTSIDNERAGLNLLLDRLFRAASFLPLDAIVVRLAEMFSKSHVLSGDGDLLIFASVMQDLLDRQRMPDFEPSIFVTGDHDFGSPAAKWLLPFSCDLLNSYDDAVVRVKESLA